jgi:hypothetical protein
MIERHMGFLQITRTVLTDVHFLVPLVVLLVGVALLVGLH